MQNKKLFIIIILKIQIYNICNNNIITIIFHIKKWFIKLKFFWINIKKIIFLKIIVSKNVLKKKKSNIK